MWTPENRGLYARPGLRYPSDLTDAEWDLVRPFLRRRTRSGPAPERLREILNAVLYVVSTGCQWRALPRDLPPRSTVHGWFVRWHCDGVLDRLHFALYQQVRELEGRHASPTAAIVDSQSVKSAEKGGGLSIRSAMTRPRKSRARSVTSSSTRWA
jgi:transposase